MAKGKARAIAKAPARTTTPQSKIIELATSPRSGGDDFFAPVGLAENGRDLLRLAEELKPDVVLLDISMPLLNGIDACKQLIKNSPQPKVIFVTMHADAD